MPSSAELPVLMYHSVSPAPRGRLRDLAVPAPLLREHLAGLARAGYALVGLTSALAMRRADPAARVVALTFDDGFRNVLRAGLPVLAAAGATATLYMSAGHAGGPASWMGAEAAEFGPLLDWPEVREVAAAGIEIGNHGWYHRPLDVLPPDELDAAVGTSVEVLRRETGAPVTSFAYPHGYHSAAVRAAVARHGHGTACEVGRRLYRPHADRPLAVPRLHPTVDHSAADLVRLVRTGGPWLEPALKRLAQPGWRMVRRVTRDRFGRELS